MKRTNHYALVLWLRASQHWYDIHYESRIPSPPISCCLVITILCRARRQSVHRGGEEEGEERTNGVIMELEVADY